MLHVHKNTDGSYHIEIMVEVDGHELLTFAGDFMRLDEDVTREKDNDSFSIDIPLNIF